MKGMVWIRGLMRDYHWQRWGLDMESLQSADIALGSKFDCNGMNRGIGQIGVVLPGTSCITLFHAENAWFTFD